MTQTARPGTDPIHPNPSKGRRGPVDGTPAQRPAAVAAVRDVCPYLLAADGAWRSSAPSRDHACAAIGAAPLALDKQRRLCLSAAHVNCPAFVVASGHDASGSESDARLSAAVARPYPRMAPVALDHGRLAPAVPAIRGDRTAAQLVLVGLMGLAFVAVAIAGLSEDGRGRVAAGAASPPVTDSPAAAAASTTAPASPAPSVDASPSVESSPASEASSAPTSSAASAPTTPASAVSRTYKVRPGDTLSGIANHFGTTVRVLKRLNGIDDPSTLRIGTVLQLPAVE